MSALRLAATVLASAAALTAHAFQGPLATPAFAVADLQRAPMFAVKRGGDHTVAVGRYGVIAVANGQGGWKQAKVDVSADLVDVAFGSDRDAWAVGHGGVILRTQDGGASWSRQLDGQQAGARALAHYRATGAQRKPEQQQELLRQAEQWAQEGVAQPFLGVWFKDAKTGYVVGTFNRVFRTVDGGANWTPIIELVDNPDALHFYGVGGRGDEVYLAGEGGNVWRWDAPQSRFVNVRTPYNGSLFGVLVTPQAVLAYGMRGSLFRSTDHGANWERIQSGVQAGLVAASVAPNGDIAVLSQAGEVLLSRDGGATFKVQTDRPRVPASGIATGRERGWLTVGAAGIRSEHGAEAASSRP